jgi:hypothetical protein
VSQTLTDRDPHRAARTESGAGARDAMPSARQKTGAGRIGVVGPGLAVLLAALGVVLIRDALIAFDVLPGPAWLPAALDGLNELTAEWWMVPAGVGAALLGLWLVVTALRPRSRRAVPVRSATGVFLHTRDVARLASDAAGAVDGVLSAASTASHRAVTVTVRSTATAGIADGVTDAVTRRLSALETPPQVKVRIRPQPHTRKEVT